MSQNSLGTINPDTVSGTALATLLNNWQAALHSGHGGASRPSYAVAGMTWVKTVSSTAHEVYYFDGTDDILLYTINPTANTISLPAFTAGTGTFGGEVISMKTGQWLSNGAAGTGNKYMNVSNTGGSYFLGIESSAGGSLAAGAAPYATVLTTAGPTNLQLGANLTKTVDISSTGVVLDGDLRVGTVAWPTSLVGQYQGRIAATGSNGNAAIILHDNTAVSGGLGGALLWTNRMTDAGQALALSAGIYGVKENTTQGDASGALLLYTNAAAGGWSEKARLSSGGIFGLGVTPSAWHSSYKALQVGGGGVPFMAGSTASGGSIGYFGVNAYLDSGVSWRYINSQPACLIETSGGAWAFKQAAAGTAGNAIPWTTAMALDASVDHAGWSASATGLRVGKTTSTGRSINAAGTINASGADYAEYVQKSIICGAVAKGAVLGIDADGRVTDKWSAALSYGIKSTAPNLVGGDVWGSADQVGERPEAPSYTAPAYEGSGDPGEPPVAPQALVLPDEPVAMEGESEETLAVFLAAWQRQCAALQAAYDDAVDGHTQALAAWDLAGAKYRLDQQAHAARVATAEAAHAALMDIYQAALADFEDHLEHARQGVDRVAFSGIVPVNVTGAQPGDYILAAEGADDSIVGVVISKAVMAANMAHYLDAVGRVRRVLPDGRAEVAVIVH